MPSRLPLATAEDRFRRPLRDLRISVTDRCNFRCVYCMPREVFGPDFAFLPRQDLLSLEEIARLARVFHQLGVTKVRLTGGEPLLRRNLPQLIRWLAEIPGLDLALTTNGSLLPELSQGLAAAGLRRVTVSLDALDPEIFARMNDTRVPVGQVLAGIAAAQAAGLGPVKVNAVVRRGLNDHAVVDLAGHFRGTGVVVRFIEYMDVGTTNGWQLADVVSGKEIIERIHAQWPLEPAEADYRGEVAQRWRYRDGAGEIGVITSVTQPFCGDCTRARLSADGQLFTCLFAATGTDLRAPLREGAGDDDLLALLTRIWQQRSDRYSELRSAATVGLPKAEMSYLGG